MLSGTDLPGLSLLLDVACLREIETQFALCEQLELKFLKCLGPVTCLCVVMYSGGYMSLCSIAFPPLNREQTTQPFMRYVMSTLGDHSPRSHSDDLS